MIISEGLAFSASNSAYRYGDGLFETIKIRSGKPILGNFHFERLFNSLLLLKYKVPDFMSPDFFEQKILELCKKNNCLQNARVRLSVSRGNGGLFDCDNKFQYLVECWPLAEPTGLLNENGLIIDVFPDAKKSIDKFSNLKSASHLLYVMAAIWVRENKLNEALILNTHGLICETAIANLFLVKDNLIYTPPLTEGCVAGVMRKYLISKLHSFGYEIKEKKIAIADAEEANECFLTNAIQGIRWVKQFRNKTFEKTFSQEIFHKLLKPFF